ncbi:GA4 desaturase [Hypoxylon rubiginosum]|uniref:GA4 desaturase n=1 Tax=Hypoxylon rubiginosum TaxID=110542 RepID=A0ACC0CMS3_9PEZI|nr:GA4 desaturase [Hypoxylon rubiginosum]
MSTTTITETQNAPAASGSQLEATFNYYSLSTAPELDYLSLLNVPVLDLRAKPLSEFTHSTHGFQILHQPLPIDASHASVHTPSVLLSQYYPSIISLLKEKLGVRCAVIINSTLRDIPIPDLSTFDPKHPRPTTGTRSLSPFFIAHSDYTPGAARAHLRAMTPDWFAATGTGDGVTAPADQELFLRLRGEIIAAEDRAAGIKPGEDAGGDSRGKGGHWDWDGKGYEGPRYAMFSIWRPWETVRRDPLAVLVSGAEADGFPYVPLPQYYNENVLVRPPTPKKGHVWGYLSEQKPDEALRRGDGSIRSMCPHSAFHTEEMNDEPVRRSCELRVWCIW